jgi:hypothetical protein
MRHRNRRVRIWKYIFLVNTTPYRPLWQEPQVDMLYPVARKPMSSHHRTGSSRKTRSARNALRHEVLDPVVRLEFQHRDPFASLHETLVAHFRPTGPVESRLVRDMAEATWRTRRCWAVETSLLETRANSAAAVARLSFSVRPRLPLPLAFAQKQRITKRTQSHFRTPPL